MKLRTRKSLCLLLFAALITLPAIADHSWGNYHWARKSNPFTLTVHDNLDPSWEPYLDQARSDWNPAGELDLAILQNSPLSSVKRCTSTNGRIEACNSKYGRTGWLGVAGIWASGSHITKAYTKVNDTYFNTATYNTPAWRGLVMCQEIAHDFGLDHQDENFNNANLGSCMDYTNSPDGPPSNVHPNAHDFEQITTIYSHTDSTTTISSVLDVVSAFSVRPPTLHEILADAGQWGTPIRFDAQGRPNLFVMPVGVNHAGERELMITHVLWAPIDPFPKREKIHIPRF